MAYATKNASPIGIGKEIGETAQVTNWMLKDQGFKDGVPGDWGLTEKGKNYLSYQKEGHYGGPGGYYPGSDVVTDMFSLEKLMPDFDTSEEARNRGRELDREYRMAQREERKRMQALYDQERGSHDETLYEPTANCEYQEDSGNGKLAIGIAVVGVGVIAYKCVKPKVVKFWNDKAKPKLISTKEKLHEKFFNKEEK